MRGNANLKQPQGAAKQPPTAPVTRHREDIGRQLNKKNHATVEKEDAKRTKFRKHVSKEAEKDKGSFVRDVMKLFLLVLSLVLVLYVYFEYFKPIPKKVK